MNKAWEKEWHAIEVPHQALEQLIANTVQTTTSVTPTQSRWSRLKTRLLQPPLGLGLGFALIAMLVFGYVLTQQGKKQEMQVSSSQKAEIAGQPSEGRTESQIFPPAGEEGSVGDGSKMIRQFELALESQNLTADTTKIKQLLTTSQGHIESAVYDLTQESSGKSVNLTLRVPVEKVEPFLAALAAVGRTLNMSESNEDQSGRYADRESRITALATEEKALLTLLEKAESVADTLAIQERLAVVRSEREQLVGQNQAIASQVAYASVTIHLYERAASSRHAQDGIPLGQRIQENFQRQQAGWLRFGKNLVVATVSYGAYVLVAVILAAMVWLRYRKKHNSQ